MKNKDLRRLFRQKWTTATPIKMSPRDNSGRWGSMKKAKTTQNLGEMNVDFVLYNVQNREDIRKDWTQFDEKTDSKTNKNVEKSGRKGQNFGKVSTLNRAETEECPQQKNEGKKATVKCKKVQKVEAVDVDVDAVSCSKNEPVDAKGGDLYIYSYRIDLFRMKEIKKTSKNQLFSTWLGRARGLASADRSLDWTRLDQWGRPVVSFTPTRKLRRSMIDTLNKPPQSKARRQLVKKLGIEYSRIYCRYRRLVQKAAGCVPSFRMPDRDTRHCEEAAVQCLRHEVTPRQVMEYWHKHIRDFADGRMQLPPVTFLKSPRNVDVVACQGPDKIGGWTIDEIRERTWQSNTIPSVFSGTTTLDKRVRHGLNCVGLHTWHMSDQELLMLQGLAESIAQGHEIFVSGRRKKMVNWIIEHIFGGRRDGRA